MFKFVKWKRKFFGELLARKWVEVDFFALRIWFNWYIGIIHLQDNSLTKRAVDVKPRKPRKVKSRKASHH